MSAEPVVRLRDAGKRYVKRDDVPTLVAGLLARGRRRRAPLWAVRHVDVSVAGGEAVGIIGRNGAGKSTLLAMLAGVTAPTEGEVAVAGRVAPLLRLGVGFHEELTGRENVYINGTILGLTEAEVDAAFDDIVAFAELEEFVDTPVKFYSSGMQARLGFSVAVASRPDVLIVDEVLAVGDIGFQMRSFERMIDLRQRGATILVVSHNLELVRRLCPRVLVMDGGGVHFDGETADGISAFHELLRTGWDADVPPRAGEEDAVLEIVGAEVVDENGRPVAHVPSSSPFQVRVRVRALRDVADPSAGLWVSNEANTLVYATNCVGASGALAAGGERSFSATMHAHLVAGAYTIGCWAGWSGPGGLRTARAPALPLSVDSPAARGVADLGAQWRIADGGAGAPTGSPGAASAPPAG